MRFVQIHFHGLGTLFAQPLIEHFAAARVRVTLDLDKIAAGVGLYLRD